MSGTDAEARAALITACVLGFAILRAALGSPAINAAEPDLIARKLGAAIQGGWRHTRSGSWPIRLPGNAIWFLRYRADGGGRTAAQRLMTIGSFGALTAEQTRKRPRSSSASSSPSAMIPPESVKPSGGK